MMTAGNMGIEIPESFIVNVGDGRDEEVLLATKRYDRAIKGRIKKNQWVKCSVQVTSGRFLSSDGNFGA